MNWKSGDSMSNRSNRPEGARDPHPLVKRAAFIGVAALAIEVLVPGLAYAHAFGTRYSLPVPLHFYLSGAGAAVLLSFVLVGFFVRTESGRSGYPRFDLLRWRWVRILFSAPVASILKALAVVLLVVTIVSGFAGVSSPTENFAPTLVWITFWVGMAYASALFGDVWTVLNPWKAVFEGAELVWTRAFHQRAFRAVLKSPPNLGVWPGVVLFFAAAWMELVFPQPADPLILAIAVVVYSLITWAGMALFGKDRWLASGEAFALVFGMFARFAPTEFVNLDTELCRDCSFDCLDDDGRCLNCSRCFRLARANDREFNLRPYALGLLRPERINRSRMILVLVMLGEVTFDGLLSTPAWAKVQSSLYNSFSAFGGVRLEAADTVGMIGFLLILIGVYWVVSELSKEVGQLGVSTTRTAHTLIYSLLPIAFAYHLAHYFPYLVINGQGIFSLISDPLGHGANFLGTAGYEIHVTILNAKDVWFMAVAAIVLGHVIAVYLSHVLALRISPGRRAAVRSQSPMIVLMVCYTVLSLWILAQPLVSNR